MEQDQLANYEEYLPETAKELIAVVGLPDTLKLVRKHGGTNILIPKEKHCGNGIHYLTEAIGEASAFKLVEHYRGTVLYLPKCDEAIRKHRNDEFCKAVEVYIIKNKASQDQAFFALCPQFGITSRTAFYVMQAKKVEKKLSDIKQDRLF